MGDRLQTCLQLSKANSIRFGGQNPLWLNVLSAGLAGFRDPSLQGVVGGPGALEDAAEGRVA